MNLDENMILLNMDYSSKDEAIRASGQLLADNGCVDESYIDAMIERDEMVSVYMGNFIAIPHGTGDAKHLVHKSGVSIIQVPNGINFGTEDDEKIVTVIFGIAGKGDEHLELLQKIATFCSSIENVAKLSDAMSKNEIMEMLKEEN